MFPNTTEINYSDEESTSSSLTFNFQDGDFVFHDGKIDKISDFEALKVWIDKIIKTCSDKYEIYVDGYGTNIQEMLFSDLPYDLKIEEIKREIKEVLNSNSNISAVSDVSIIRNTKGITINLTVSTIFGIVESEVNLSG